MKNSNILKVVALSITLLVGSASFAQEEMVKEKTVKATSGMSPSKNIVENLVNSKDHTTLVAAVRVAELTKVLQGDGPFTVFAPTNAAFKNLAAGTLDSLLKPENSAALQNILMSHVLAGDFKAADIVEAIKKGNGTASFETLSGSKLIATLNGKSVIIKDENGSTSTVKIPNVNNSNGVIHVVDTVVSTSK